MSADPFDIAAQLRRSGVEHLSEEDKATFRAHLETLSPRKRVRERYIGGASFVEEEIDELWNLFGRRPTSAEYLALVPLLQEAIEYCRKEAAEVKERGRRARP